jgi:branched-chain amino acid transport system permease protein
MRRLIFHPCGNFNERYEQELTIFETDFGRVSLWIGLFFVFIIIPLLFKTTFTISSPYFFYILNLAGIAAIASIGLNLLMGFTGQISLGHGAFVGVGAYSAAILATRLHFPFWISVPAAGVLTAMVGLIFGIPSGRLKHLYLTIATLAGQFIIEYVLVHWESVTQGTMGIILPTATIFGLSLGNDLSFYIVIYLSLVLMTWIGVNIVRTRYGRAFIAIRDNDMAAAGMGIHLFRYKLLSFAISSFYAGIAGAFLAYYTISITPEPFNLFLSIEYIAMVIIGGLGNIAGSIYGAMFITLLVEALRWGTEILMNIEILRNVAITIAPLREFVFGLAIVLFILFEPKGLAEVWRIVRSSFRLWPFSY